IQIDRKRRERRFELEDNGVFVEGRYRLQFPISTFLCRQESGIQHESVGVDHIRGAQFVAVVKVNASSQDGDIGQWIWMLEAFRQPGDDAQMVVELDEIVV